MTCFADNLYLLINVGMHLLTLSVQGNAVTFHPGGGLCPRLRPHSACILSKLIYALWNAGEVTFKGGDIHTARSV